MTIKFNFELKSVYILKSLFCRFEIVVTFTGTSLSSGQTKEERTSYLSSEILWGHRFVNMMDYNSNTRDYLVDYDLFDKTEEVNK